MPSLCDILVAPSRRDGVVGVGARVWSGVSDPGEVTETLRAARRS
jgi:hypothetical protein